MTDDTDKTEGAQDDFSIGLEPTGRGFMRGEFSDLYDQLCSIQESSLATEGALWLGVDRNIPESGGGPGEWVNERMHLSRPMAKELIGLLTHFVETGLLPDAEGDQ